MTTSNANPIISRGNAHLDRLWHAGNDAGEGFDPKLDAFEVELARAFVVAGSDVVARVQLGERVLAVGWLHGLWAVDVTGEAQ
jgi:hypothetical protein